MYDLVKFLILDLSSNFSPWTSNRNSFWSCPASFFAEHVYPAESSTVAPIICSVCPFCRMRMCRASVRFMGSPSLNHVMLGSGVPYGRHSRRMAPRWTTETVDGSRLLGILAGTEIVISRVRHEEEIHNHFVREKDSLEYLWWNVLGSTCFWEVNNG